MTRVVYIDVLFVINLIFNYFILLAVSSLLHRKDKKWRLLLGACLGAVYSLLIFFPSINFLYSAALKFVFSVAIVAVAYRFSTLRNLIKLIVYFYLISLLFGGVIFGLYLFATPPGMLMRNGVFYVDISPVILILSSAGCYVVIHIFSRFLHRHIDTESIYQIEIVVGTNGVSAAAFMDTGNTLCDPITGMPVIVAEYGTVEKLFPPMLRPAFKKGKIDHPDVFDAAGWKGRFRMIPFGSVGNSGGLLPAFRPDRIIVRGTGRETKISEILI
ncbi:MAG TPA: sigma-E processing peptidase SpoIIGA, partial [Clostridia bacterium]|nr:sigma-E processing peptidase SpoIIGA [Clostridia bacterium]